MVGENDAFVEQGRWESVRMGVDMHNETVEELVERFLARGGKIDKSYLSPNVTTRRALVNLNGWFGGKNLREAITRAFAGQ